MVKTGDKLAGALAAFWRRRAGVGYCDFDRVADVPPPAGATVRPPPLHLEDAGRRDRTLLFEDAVREVAELILAGDALSFAEYHLAVGLGLMRLFVGDEYPDYKKFFTTRWHMTAGHKAYVPAGKCGVCQAAKRPRAEGK